jgi:hypothetical protein
LRFIAAILALCLSASAASAQSCTAQATDKKLAGAAKTSFLTKCERDAGEACEAQATERKLFGPARASFTKKCVGDAVES